MAALPPYAIAALAATAVASTVSAVGSYRQGQYAEAAGEYNAAVAGREAEAARYKAEYEAEESARKFKILAGRQRALYAKAGVDIASGSPLLLMAAQAEEAERERQAILYGGKVGSQSALNKGALFRFQGSQAAQAGKIQAGTTLLTSLGNVGTQYYNWQKPRGVFY